MPESANYYEILGVQAQAGSIEIKRAYFTAVRKFPPERFPGEFKKIREAYDTLSDPESRSEYDLNLESTGFGKYFQQADQAYKEQRYDIAIELLKEALKLLPGNRIARHLTGLCLLEKEEWEKAAALYKRLTYEFPENPVYRYHLGAAFLGEKAYRQALEALEAVLALDGGYVSAWVDAGFCHFVFKDYAKARETLHKGLTACGENISIYMKLVEVDVTEQDMDRLKYDIARLEKLAREDEDARENVAWYLARLAEDLMQDLPDFAAKLLEKAKKLEPEEKEIKSLYKDAAKIKKLREPLERLKKDPRVHPWIKDVAAKAVMGCDDPFEELNISVCERMLLRNPANVLSSVQHLELAYLEIFKEHKKFFRQILDHPVGARVDEKRLLQDVKKLELLAGRPSGGNEPISLDDFYVPPLQKINTVTVGRNDPCPCGSGKKYKKCCGR